MYMNLMCDLLQFCWFILADLVIIIIIVILYARITFGMDVLQVESVHTRAKVVLIIKDQTSLHITQSESPNSRIIVTCGCLTCSSRELA